MGGVAESEGGGFGLHEGLAGVPVGLAVGVDGVLVDAPSDFDCDVLVTGEQIKNLVLLARGGRAGSGVRDAPRLVQGISGAAAPCVELLLDAPTALIEGVTGQAYDMEGIHDRRGIGQFFGGRSLESGESVHRDGLDAFAPSVGLGGEPGLEDLLGAARDHVRQTRGTTAVLDGRQVQDDGDAPCRRGECAARRVHQRRSRAHPQNAACRR